MGESYYVANSIKSLRVFLSNGDDCLSFEISVEILHCN